MKLIPRQSLLCYAILACQGTQEEKLRFLFDVFCFFNSSGHRKFVSKIAVEQSTVFETLVEVAVVHYIKYSNSARMPDYGNIKVTFEGFEVEYRDSLIQKMKYDQKPSDPNVNGFIDQLFREEPRLSLDRFIEKVSESLSLNWILYPEDIIDRMIRFDTIYEDQELDFRKKDLSQQLNQKTGNTDRSAGLASTSSKLKKHRQQRPIQAHYQKNYNQIFNNSQQMSASRNQSRQINRLSFGEPSTSQHMSAVEDRIVKQDPISQFFSQGSSEIKRMNQDILLNSQQSSLSPGKHYNASQDLKFQTLVQPLNISPINSGETSKQQGALIQKLKSKTMPRNQNSPTNTSTDNKSSQHGSQTGSHRRRDRRKAK